MRSRSTARLVGVWAFYLVIPLLATTSESRADPVTSGGPNTFNTAQNVNGFFSLAPNPNIGSGAGAGFVNTSTTIPHVEITLTAGGAGRYFYRFTVVTPGLAIFDIDDLPVDTNFDTELVLSNTLDPGGFDFAFNDDAAGDPGDGVLSNLNSRIQFNLGVGDYVVRVQQFHLADVGAGGSFTLNISAGAAVSARVPEPGSLALFGTALVAVGTFGRRRKRVRAS